MIKYQTADPLFQLSISIHTFTALKELIKDQFMPDTPLFYVDTDTDWEDLGDGVTRKICGYDDKIMLVKVKFEVGAIGPLHEHFHSQVTYVDSGVFEASIDGNKQILQAGDSFYAPPHNIHGVLCIEAGVLIDVFSPMRGDFIGG